MNDPFSQISKPLIADTDSITKPIMPKVVDLETSLPFSVSSQQSDIYNDLTNSNKPFNKSEFFEEIKSWVNKEVLSRLDNINSSSSIDPTSQDTTIKGTAEFIIPNSIKYNFSFIKLQVESPLCILVVEPDDFKLQVATGTIVAINVNSENLLNLKLVSSKIQLILKGVEYNMYLFLQQADTPKVKENL